MRRFLALIGLLAASVVWAGCHPEEKKEPGQTAPPQATPGFPRTLTDARGQKLTLQAPPQRILSLIPSDTEVLYALGASERVVAVTAADDYPPEVKQKPSVANVYTAEVEPILAQKPDLVLAIESLNQKPIAALEALHVPVFVIDPKNVTETYAAIRLLGQVVGMEAKAEQVVTEMQARMTAIQSIVSKATHRPKVLIMYGTDPIYTTGPNTFINELITQAGGQNIVDTPIANNIISAEEVALRQPEVILCGKTLTEKVRNMPGWAQSVPAVKNSRLYAEEPPDGTLIRPTPRLVKGVEALARYLHPELDWKPLDTAASHP